MTALDTAGRPAKAVATPLFVVTVFSGAGLVFLVQPMVTKLLLPLLGGGPSIWNTSVAFFQIALLAGYGYAHLLQRAGPVRRQAAIHGVALLAAALVLPLRVNGWMGDPWPGHPALWLLCVLTLSLGAPFAILSATAPMVQAWYAKVAPPGGRGPYSLYAASNLGSLLALLAYPVVVEPLTTLQVQTLGWSLGYGAFVLLIAALSLTVGRDRAGVKVVADAPAAPVTARDRLAWVALAAIPSSLMLGVTTYLTTDVASAPFLWVAPLALYLCTFIVAFQDRPPISRGLALTLQAAALAVCATTTAFRTSTFAAQLPVQLLSFFLTALVCHQALVARRPSSSRLTEFYLWMSVGGVVGGAFNAFLAPVIFANVWEYPLVLALACLARPDRSDSPARRAWLVLGVASAIAAPVIARLTLPAELQPELATKVLLAAATVSAFMVRDRRVLFFGMIALVLGASSASASRTDVRQSWRSFFGVMHRSQMPVEAMGGTVRMLAHGSTLHGAQAMDPRWRCRPLVYYAPETPIGQVFGRVGLAKPAITVGAVGLGTGAVAAYTRPADRLTFFEIDPLVVRISSDPRQFSYTTECARGHVGYVVGDARLTLARQPAGSFDILLIDAFSSDSVPAHLLTVEAVRMYLGKLKPDGVLILHLSNRHLNLRDPAMAVAAAAGAHSLLQRHSAAKNAPVLWESSEDALIIAKSPAALAAFARDPRWRPGEPSRAKPWTDDYTNLAGALYANAKDNWKWLP